MFLTFQCVGFQQDTSVKDRFALSTTPLNKTLVAASLDGGTSWSSLGFLPSAQWRLGVVPFGGDRLAFGFGTGFSHARHQQIGCWQFDNSAVLVPGLSWGWTDSFYKNDKIQSLEAVYANIWGSTVVSRVPGGNLLLIALPATTLGNPG